MRTLILTALDVAMQFGLWHLINWVRIGEPVAPTVEQLAFSLAVLALIRLRDKEFSQ